MSSAPPLASASTRATRVLAHALASSPARELAPGAGAGSFVLQVTPPSPAARPVALPGAEADAETTRSADAAAGTATSPAPTNLPAPPSATPPAAVQSGAEGPARATLELPRPAPRRLEGRPSGRTEVRRPRRTLAHPPEQPDLAARAVAAVDALTDDFAFGSPGLLSVAMRPTPARINGLLARSDASQRPWGVSLSPPVTGRFVLEHPTQVGRGHPTTVTAEAVVGFGMGISSGVGLPLLGLATLLLPTPWLGTAPKTLLAVVTFLAIGLTPRGAFARHHLVSRRVALSPEALAEVAARRDGLVQWVLTWLNLDGLRALPAALHAPEGSYPFALHESRRTERAAASEWGGGLMCGLASLGLSLSGIWMHHDNHARCLEVSRPDHDTVRVQLSEVLSQQWRASFVEGLLWGTQHRGLGKQTVRVSLCERTPFSTEAEALLADEAGVLAGTHELARGVADAVVLQVEQVRSSGAGWRWPFWLPRYKTLGVGEVRQTFVVTRRGAHASVGRVALGVSGMDETLRGGRVNWQLRVDWRASPPRTDARGHAVFNDDPPLCRIDLQIYVPWCSPTRRALLVNALDLPQLTRLQHSVPPQQGWRYDLQLHLCATVPPGALQATPAAAPIDGPHAQTLSPATRVAPPPQPLTTLLRRATAAGESSSSGDDETWLNAMAAHGPRLYAALREEGAIATPPHVQASYGQTKTTLQDAAWHLAAKAADGAPGWRWRRRAHALVLALQAEDRALARCPFTQAMPPPQRAVVRNDLAHVHRRLVAALQRPTHDTNERTPLLPNHTFAGL